ALVRLGSRRSASRHCSIALSGWPWSYSSSAAMRAAWASICCCSFWESPSCAGTSVRGHQTLTSDRPTPTRRDRLPPLLLSLTTIPQHPTCLGLDQSASSTAWMNRSTCSRTNALRRSQVRLDCASACVLLYLTVGCP